MRLLIVFLCFCCMILPVSGLEIEAPEVPQAGKEWMPKNTESLLDGIIELVEHVFSAVSPDIREASNACTTMVAAVLVISLLETVCSQAKSAAQTAGVVTIVLLLLQSTNSLIRLASDTILEMSEYGKLLLPVMTTALAAQGGVSSSAALYAGTAFFSSILQSLLGSALIPGIYLYLALCSANGATGEKLLKSMADLLKGLMTWFLKILLMIFTTFLSLTGVISGTTDAAALKAAKVAVSSFVPVVGGVLSDASEAVLIGAGVLKSAAGIYGILAILALFLYPFLKIGLHYMVLKLTAAVCDLFAGSRVTEVIHGFGNALGMLLGMTAAVCVMILVSTVCFMRGIE